MSVGVTTHKGLITQLVFTTDFVPARRISSPTFAGFAQKTKKSDRRTLFQFDHRDQGKEHYSASV
jgi:hypothetical protein